MNQANKPTIILLHGIMGSVLTKKGRQVWPLITTDLDHYPKSLTPVSNTDHIEAYDTLSTYKPLVKALEREGYKVIKRVYDWRKNNIEHLDNLKEDIINDSNDEVVIIGHSMGGIIAKLCLNKFSDVEGIDKVKKLITIGTPWNGSMDAIKTLKYGSKIPEMSWVTLLTRNISKRISCFFSSTYQLLPNQGYLNHIRKENILPCKFNGNQYYNFLNLYEDIFKEEFEINHKFIEVFDEYFDLLKTELSGDVEHHEIIGVGIATISVISEKANNEPSAFWDDGDGTVPLFSAYSGRDHPKYFPYFTRKTKHSNLPKYNIIQESIKNIISNSPRTPENEHICYSLESPFYKKFEGYIQKVACPVDVSLINKDGQIIYGEIDAFSEDEIREIMSEDYQVNTLGTTTYIVYDNEQNTNIDNFKELTIKAYDKGPTSVSIDKFENGKVVQRNAFNTFNIDSDKEAIVKLNSDMGKSTLVITTSAGELIDQQVLHEIEIDDSKVLLPETKIKTDGNFIKKHPQNENVLYAKNEVTISVESIVKGSFDVHETYILIGKKHYTVKEGETLPLTSDLLEEGENLIQFYSIDTFDNSENRKQFIIFYIKEAYEKFEFLFHHQSYAISIKENKQYKRMVKDLLLQKTEPQLIFDNEYGVTGHFIVYDNIERKLTIKLKDIFDDEEIYNVIIDEKLIKEAIRGTATTKNIEKIISNFNLRNPKLKFDMIGSGKPGQFTVIRNQTLNDCKSIIILDDRGFDIKINKNVVYDVKFGSLTEKINLKNEMKYPFTFTVFDKVLNEYVINLKLKATLITTINQEHYEDEFEVIFIGDEEHYYFDLELEKTEEFLREFWTKKIGILANATLYIKNSNGVTIRPLEITFENN